jgi:hypothetical protein
MYKRIWRPTVCESSRTESKITIYDFGAYYGELVDDDWTCWEILSRVRAENGEIEEELRLMNQDWVPFDSYHSQRYTGYVSGDNTFIRGWSIRTTKMTDINHPLPDPVHPRQLAQQRQQQQPQRQPRQQRQQPQRQQQQQQQRQQQQQPQRQQQPAKVLRGNTQVMRNTIGVLSPQWTPLVQVAQPV